MKGIHGTFIPDGRGRGGGMAAGIGALVLVGVVVNVAGGGHVSEPAATGGQVKPAPVAAVAHGGGPMPWWLIVLISVGSGVLSVLLMVAVRRVRAHNARVRAEDEQTRQRLASRVRPAAPWYKPAPNPLEFVNELDREYDRHLREHRA